MAPKVFFLTPAHRFPVDGRKRRFSNTVVSYTPCKKCYLFSIVLAFLCGRAKMIRIRYVYAYLFEGKRRKKKILVFKTIRIRVNFRSSCIPLQIIMAIGLIRTVGSLIDFVSHVLFSVRLGMKIWERYMVALMD